MLGNGLLQTGQLTHHLGQVDDILVSGRSSKEGAELALKAALGQNERTVGSGSGGCLGRGRAGALTGRSRSGRSSTAAACQHADAESGSRCQCNGLLGVFHVVKPPIICHHPQINIALPKSATRERGSPLSAPCVSLQRTLVDNDLVYKIP